MPPKDSQKASLTFAFISVLSELYGLSLMGLYLLLAKEIAQIRSNLAAIDLDSSGQFSFVPQLTMLLKNEFAEVKDNPGKVVNVK